MLPLGYMYLSDKKSREAYSSSYSQTPWNFFHQTGLDQLIVQWCRLVQIQSHLRSAVFTKQVRFESMQWCSALPCRLLSHSGAVTHFLTLFCPHSFWIVGISVPVVIGWSDHFILVLIERVCKHDVQAISLTGKPVLPFSAALSTPILKRRQSFVLKSSRMSVNISREDSLATEKQNGYLFNT